MTGELHSTEYQRFLASLRKLRKEQGLSQVELAKRMGVAQAFVSKSERGERRLDLIEIFKWLTALGCAVPAFLAAEYRRWKAA